VIDHDLDLLVAADYLIDMVSALAGGRPHTRGADALGRRE